jgi:hypothetical protein
MKKNNKNNSPVDDKSVDELVGELRNSFAKRDAVLFYLFLFFVIVIIVIKFLFPDL